ncbi:MAG: MMPL family transporter [Acidimicrobiales bacterium]|jgi:RND superfamily putative drug exporter
MLNAVGRVATARGRLVLVATLLVVLAAGAFGGSAVSHLSSGGFTDPSSPSTKADALLSSQFHQGEANLVFLVHSPSGVNSPAARTVGAALVRDLADHRYVSGVSSYWSAPAATRSGLESRDGRYGLVTASVAGSDSLAPSRGEAIAEEYAGTRDGVTVTAGGATVINYQINRQVSHDLAVAESVAVPLTLLALLAVFGSALAALLPLVIGGVAIVGTLAVLRLLTLFVPVSIFALNLTTALGLGLAIDYSLFILTRYREERRAGHDVPLAVRAAVRSAGRTVLFSSVAVGLSMAAMLVFPFYFLRSFAYAGMAVVVIAALGAVVVLPALLAVMGPRVDAWDVRRLVRRSPATAAAPGRSWRRLALAVMRRPVVFGLGVVAVLALLGAPFLSVRFGLPDDRVLPASATSHQVADVLRADFSSDSADALTVVLPDSSGAPRTELNAYVRQLSSLSGVTGVVSPLGTFASGRHVAGPATPWSGAGTYLTIVNDVEPYSAPGSSLVAAVRTLPAPSPALVTGQAARSVDSLNALFGVLPFALGLIALSTLVILFAFTRSVVLPVKALVLNVLSLSATFGAMVWVFQEGHLSHLLGGVGATGYLTASMPVLMFCIAFGLSMDYEVFLLSRIKEHWDLSDRTTEANTTAVVAGLEGTGRVITAAAALISIVFLAMVTSQVSFIKMFGLGMALAVLMDATLVRGVLVPAFMRVAGRANWWAPGWLSPGTGRRPRSTSPAKVHVANADYEIPPA